MCFKCEVIRYFSPFILYTYVVSDPACDGGLLTVTFSRGKAVHGKFFDKCRKNIKGKIAGLVLKEVTKS